MSRERKLREQAREQGFKRIAEKDDVLRGTLAKAAEGKIWVPGEGDIYTLLRDTDHTPYARWCAECNTAWKIYQKPCRAKECSNYE